jgi:transaldolase
MTVETGLRSPLFEMAETTPTDYWNDSCAIDELTYAIANGAVGATSNPTIVGEVLVKEMDDWRPRIVELARANET